MTAAVLDVRRALLCPCGCGSAWIRWGIAPPCMSQPTKQRDLLTWPLLTILAAPILLLIASEFGSFPWSGINCTHGDVDIRTGRIRHSRYVLSIPVQRKVEDSSLTRALLP